MEKRYSIEELERESDFSFEEAIREYYESCVRQGYTDLEECAFYFCDENMLHEYECARVLSALKEIDSEYEHQNRMRRI